MREPCFAVLEVPSNELQQPHVLDSFSHLPHQFVVIDSIEKLFQVEIDHPAVVRGDILLRLSYRPRD
jgi:hypothetical protein